MIFNDLSIRYRILLLPCLALLLLAGIEAVDHYINTKLKIIATENDTCHQIALALSEMLHHESDYVVSGSDTLLAEIKKKQEHIAELLQTSQLIVPRYRNPLTEKTISQILAQHSTVFDEVAHLQKQISETNVKILSLYNERNKLAQTKIDEIILHEYQHLMATGTTISNAKKELANVLKELTSLHAKATLNTTELYYLGNQQQYLGKEEELNKQTRIVINAGDALSAVTEDDTDLEDWTKIIEYHNRISTLREQLFNLWETRRELTINLPITDSALQDFSSFIIQQMKKERGTAAAFHNKYSAATLFLAIIILIGTSFYILRSILPPITRLTEGTKLIKEGTQDVHIKVENRDELGELATTVNEMVIARKAMLQTLEENERQYRRVLETTGTIPWELELDTLRFTYVGHQAVQILGYPVDSWVDFDSWANMIHPDDREYATEFCKSATEKGKDHEFNYRMLHQNGSTVWVRDTVSVVIENEKPVILVGFIHDITQQKIAEEEKANLEERLQQAQKMEAIGTLAGGIAHDFNNLLGIILGYADMIKEDAPPGSTLAEDLEKILQASYRAKDLVQQILAFSRQSSTELQAFSPASIVKEAIKMLRSSIPTTITIQEKINPNCDTILADPTQLHQILMNICTNSYHALEKAGGILAISMDNITLTEQEILNKPDFRPGNFVKLTIADNGPGIKPAIQDKIFDPYFTTKDIGKGTGMGLSIVHGIITSYGGIIDFESAPGEGTTFYVYFPVAEQPGVDSEENGTPLPTGKERILLVDDEDLLIDMVSDMLERLGYDVTARISSLEALQTFKNQPEDFDLVITDQTMPGMTGETLARRILQIRPDVPIILCTGYSTVISEQKAKSIGIREFALKPLVKKDVAKLIRKVLDG